MIHDDDHGAASPDEQGGTATATTVDRRGGRQFDRSRLRLGLVIAVICGALAFLVMQGLGDATMFFRNADEAVRQRDELGTARFRLQGTVVPGTVQEVASTSDPAVEFLVEFHCEQVAVHHVGTPPELFRPGVPVVLEGAFEQGSGTYRSDTIRVRHTEEYTAEEKERLELAEQEACAT